MGLIPRYVFWQVVTTTLGAVLLLVFLLVAGRAFKEVIAYVANGQLTPTAFFQLLVLVSPYLFSYAFPLGLLTAILLVFGRLSAQREIIAMKAAGFSLWRMARPVYFFALVAAVGAVFVNAYVSPVAKGAYRSVLYEELRAQPLRLITPGELVRDFANVILFVQEQAGEELRGLWLWELDSDGELARTIFAERAHLGLEEAQGALRLTLFDGSVEVRAPEASLLDEVPTRLRFAETVLRLDLAGVFSPSQRRRSLGEMSMGELAARIDVLAQQVRDPPPAWTPKELAAQRHQLGRTRFELHKNVALGVAVLAFAWVAIPLGVRVGRSETYANFAVGLGIALVYYVLIVAVTWVDLGRSWRPDLLVWLPNLVFLVLGGLFYRRANRY